ncbi:MAG: glycosyltransferase [Desulfobacteraceae bacterium]|nr:MAG: glycosyltransferase [Desulfobacteraceae bacterium]
MNILYVTIQDLTRPGGARSHVLGFCEGLKALGNDVRIVSPYDEETKERHGRNGILGRTLHMLKLVKMHRTIVECIRSGWPEIVYFRRGYLNPGLLTAFTACGVKVFLEINSILENESFNLIRHVVSRASAIADHLRFMKADLLVAVSDGLREHLLSTYKRIPSSKVLVVINGVDTKVFFPRNRRECRKELGIDQDAFVVVFAGKAAERHGLNKAVAAMNILKRKHGGRVHLHIVGDGPALREVERSVALSGLEDAVHFEGMRPHEELTRFIGASNLCISPHSAWPTNSIGVSPLKIFEYLACGRPIICSDVKGIGRIMEEIEGEGDITLVRPDDEFSLAAAIERSMDAQVKSRTRIEELHRKISWKARAEIVYDQMRKHAAHRKSNIGALELHQNRSGST